MEVIAVYNKTTSENLESVYMNRILALFSGVVVLEVTVLKTMI